MRQAADLGVTVFDSAEAYGWGRSEEMLGRALGNRDDVLIATKMCRIRETGEKEYSAARMMETVEDSLRRLQRDRIMYHAMSHPSVIRGLRDMQQRVSHCAGCLAPFVQGLLDGPGGVA